MMRARLKPGQWPLLAVVASAAMLGAAHLFQHFGYAPCMLCLRQREVYWAALAVGAVGFLLGRWRPGWKRLASALLVPLFFIGAGVAGYHAGVEWHWWPGPTACSGAAGGTVSAGALSELLAGAKVRPPACDVAAWRMFGLSMAGYNFLISLGLAGLSLLAASRRS